MTDSSPEYIDKMLSAIVGIEVEITKMAGKWKLSQTRRNEIASTPQRNSGSAARNTSPPRCGAPSAARTRSDPRHVGNTMSFMAFVIAAVVLANTPGPGIAYVVARTVAGGRSEGIASCFGTAIGGMVHVLAAALGLSLIVARSAVAFDLVKYLGAAYLVYLGIRLLLRNDPLPTIETVASQGVRGALFEGSLSRP